ncbi:hypothetical protein HKD37_10G029886 [Glycine soja]
MAVSTTWTATRQLHWRVYQVPPRVQLAISIGESPPETDPPEKSFKTAPFRNKFLKGTYFD